MVSYSNSNLTCDYVVVGSGAGGGTVASRLAEAGYSVVVLEAGGDPHKLHGGDPGHPDVNRLPHDYEVPAFHGFASENEAMKWDYFVRHYADDAQQRLDPKYYEEFQGRQVNGVLYPRAGTLGGCTAHNAMIFVAPNNSDWDHIAELAKDESWKADRMWKYFERVENCRYRPLHRWLAKIGFNPSRHGWRGWLHAEEAMPMAELEHDRALRHVLEDSICRAFFEEKDKLKRLERFQKTAMDPNDWRLVNIDADGPRFVPLTTRKHARIGTRERLLEVQKKYPNLRIELNALATRVIFDESKRAIGVEYLQGERLYRAHARVNPSVGETRRIYASKEVILAGGTFNTPQLLMLSGIGPGDVLKKWKIPVVADLPGVGQNLQDRYEIGIVNRMKFPVWQVYEDAKFNETDSQFRQWAHCRRGVYATNGSVITVFRKSSVAQGPPDIFCMALLAKFEGYYPNYSQAFTKESNYLTWVILKGHTRNRKGVVTLRSGDPLDTPEINFHYFEEGGDDDLTAMVEGVKFVRTLTQPLKVGQLIEEEELPGDEKQSPEALKTFIRNNAWGHHASCTCAIGPSEQGGVLRSDFKVHGVEGLRVVDASVFPRIPGFFIVCAIYMIAEKAADVILASR